MYEVSIHKWKRTTFLLEKVKLLQLRYKPAYLYVADPGVSSDFYQGPSHSLRSGTWWASPQAPAPSGGHLPPGGYRVFQATRLQQSDLEVTPPLPLHHLKLWSHPLIWCPLEDGWRMQRGGGCHTVALFLSYGTRGVEGRRWPGATNALLWLEDSWYSIHILHVEYD